MINRNLAFHGDVLNTTARIQELCNKYGRKLLISGNLKHQIGDVYSIPYDLEPLGNQKLKGKHENVDVFAVMKKKKEVMETKSLSPNLLPKFDRVDS